MPRCARRSTGPTTCSTADEQRVLARLSVFAGGCSLEAAEAVCSGAGIDEVEVLDLLSALVARSLVVAEDAPSGERRYRLLETIRQYAEERVDDAERAELRDRHADFYVDFAETAADGLRGPDQLRWLLEVESELENIRAALAWSVAAKDAVRAARFLCSVRRRTEPAGPGAATRRRSDTRAAGHRDDRALPVRTRGRRRRLPCSTACSNEPSSSARKHSMRRVSPTTSSPDLRSSARANARHGLGDVTGAVQVHGAVGERVSPPRRSVHARVLSRRPRLVPIGAETPLPWLPTKHERLSPWPARLAIPVSISVALAVLALILVGTEPEQSRTLIAESIEINDALGDIVVDENTLVVAFMVSALLGERDQALRLTARGLDRGISMLVDLLRLPRGHRADARPRATRRRGNAARDHRQARSQPRGRRTVPGPARTRNRSNQHPTRRGAHQRAARTRCGHDRGPSHRVRARSHRPRSVNVHSEWGRFRG